MQEPPVCHLRAALYTQIQIPMRSLATQSIESEGRVISDR